MAERRSRRRPVPAVVDAITPSSFNQEQGITLWREAATRLKGSRDRMLDAQDIALGKIQLVPPKHLTRYDKQVARLVPKLAQRKSLVLNMTNLVAADRPVVKRQRPPKGGPTGEARAEETETAVQALLLDLLPWEASAGRSVQYAQFALTTLLAEDAWDAAPESDDTLSEDEWKKLSAKDQKTYRKAEAAEGETTYKRTKQTYWRDKQGRGVEHPEYDGRRDTKKTKQAYDDDWEDHCAQHPPFVIRGYSPFDFAYETDGEKITYLGIRQLMTVNALVAKGYRGSWLSIGEDGKGRAMMPQGVDAQYWGRGDKLWLYQHFLWLDGDPHVAYQVGGQSTNLLEADGTEVPAVVNLREKWGFTRLPVGVYEGQHLETDNPDDRPVPFMEPVGDSIVAMEGLIGAANLTAWRHGTSKIGIVPAQNVPSLAYLDKENQLKPVDVDPDSDVVTLYGPTQSIAPIEQSHTAEWVVAQLGASVADATPSGAAFGQGGDTSSGREAALLHTYAQTSQDMTREGLRQAYEEHASFLLEWACCYMRTKKISEIPFYANVDAEPQEGASEEGSKTVMVRLREDWIGRNYRLTAEYLPSPNPILIEQEVTLAEKGYGSFADVQKARGKTNVLKARIDAINDRHWMSEQGQAELAAIDARARGDIEKAKQLDAIMAEKAVPLAFGPDGKPVAVGPSAALDESFQGDAGPTSAQAAYAGTIGGGKAADMQDFATAASAPAPGGILPQNGAGGGMA